MVVPRTGRVVRVWEETRRWVELNFNKGELPEFFSEN